MLKKIEITKFVSLIVRGIGIGSRFLLTFLLTKYISLEFQGDYTLLVSTVAILTIFFGFDFYVFSNREIIKTKDQHVFCLKNMLVFCLISYLILLPLLWVGTIFSSINITFFWVLYFLIVFDHLGQEFFRIYIAFKMPLLANILLFIRTGLWASLIVLYFLFSPSHDDITLESILYLWLFCAFLTCILGFYFFPGINKIFKTNIDFLWIKNGLIVGATMFTSTICLKIIEYSDRYLIAFFLDKKELGIYAFYFQLANIVNVVIFTMYISFVYPDIIKSVYDKSQENLLIAQKTIKRKTVYIIVLCGILSIFFLPLFLNFIDKPELNNNTMVYYIMLLSSLFLNYSFSSHFVIIGEEKEKLIFKATFYACILNVILNLALIPIIGIYGSALALMASNFILFFLKRKYEKLVLSNWV